MRIGIVIPARNEEALIGRCLESIHLAIDEATRLGHVCKLYVVCDSCEDDTASVVLAAGHVPLLVEAQNVGAVRAYGAHRAIGDGAEWLAFTDADSTVSPSWLTCQIALGKDVVCGTVQVSDWEEYGDVLALHFSRTYFDRDGHSHIHGANLGMRTEIYQRVGGFDALANAEDIEIVRAMEALDASIAWSNAPRVTTSARSAFRATAGFGATLAAVAADYRSSMSGIALKP